MAFSACKRLERNVDLQEVDLDDGAAGTLARPVEIGKFGHSAISEEISAGFLKNVFDKILIKF